MPKNHDNSQRKNHCQKVGKKGYGDDIQNLSWFVKMNNEKTKKKRKNKKNNKTT